MTDLATLQMPSEMMSYLSGKEVEDTVDADESVNVPVLRVVQKNSNNVETADGQDAAPGTFYYKPTAKDYKELIVNIIYIKQVTLKTKVWGTEDEYEDKKHYLITGVIADTNELFVTYVKGLSYSSVWDLLEMTNPYRKHPSTPVPLYALNIKLYTEKEDTNYGVTYVLKYSLIREENGAPTLVDLNKFQWLEQQVAPAKKMTERLIEINHSDGVDLEAQDISYTNGDEAEIDIDEAQEVADEVPF